MPLEVRNRPLIAQLPRWHESFGPAGQLTQRAQTWLNPKAKSVNFLHWPAFIDASIIDELRW